MCPDHFPYSRVILFMLIHASDIFYKFSIKCGKKALKNQSLTEQTEVVLHFVCLPTFVSAVLHVVFHIRE